MTHSLAQQVVLITGASAGIGAALARLLAQQYKGIRLVLAARRADTLEALAKECRTLGAEVLVVPTDMAQTDQVVTLATQAIAQFGRVDTLVNNAGYGQMGPIELVPQEAIEQQFAVNVLGAIALIRALIPNMRDQGGGLIINVSSLAGRMAFPLVGTYSASKFALEGVSDALRRELEPFNIRVSVIEPGPVQTEFVEVAQKRALATIPNADQSPYQAAFEQLQTLEQRTARQTWSSEQVAHVILKAMTARYPRPRYIAATGGEILVFLMTKVLPTRWSDRFWQRFYGIHKIKGARG
ncbi:SDR family NAD(P)-dependent oxidoreductase [Leptolyngbya sp. AN02str]|uniref:SDR family NAD(P)-dependent oxidoreductase n=1 Tax=Leptolyngbya sp. AN02str TaxID=3423363 RepID=UPI003D31B14B